MRLLTYHGATQKLKIMTSQTKITKFYGVRSSVEANLAKATPRCLESTSPKATGSPTPALGTRGRTRRKDTSLNKSKSLEVMHWNAEGVFHKEDELRHLLHRRDVDVCCIQETHLKKGKSFKVRGYQTLRLDRPDRHKGGVLTLVRNNIHALEVSTHQGGAEYQHIKLRTKSSEVSIINYYCPNDQPHSLDTIDVKDNFIIVGDFNSHSQSWGYPNSDARGIELEEWQDEHNLILVNDPNDPSTFYHRGWRTCSTPDLAFCTEEVHKGIKREVGQQLGGSDHRPVFITIGNNVIPIVNTRPRWNYKKAKWTLFALRANELTRDIVVQGRNENCITKEWTKAILTAAKEAIPRGARKDYKPFWSQELQELEDDLNKARDDAEKEPNDGNTIKLQKAKAKFLKTKLIAKRKAWRSKTGSLNMEKDTTALWKLTKSLNEEATRGATVTLDEGGGILTGKQAADCFAKTYEKESDITVTTEQRRKARSDRRERAKANSRESMTLPLTLQELDNALKKLKLKKSPGPDGITNEMLIHLDTTARLKLLEIFNLTWEEGRVPQMWKEATMIPIHKKGKDKRKSGSYRPISLTSCVVKTMERIVNRRLMHHLESEKILAQEQAGFRQFRSTEDQTTYLAQEIEDAFQNKNVLFATWIDLQKAFDKVWTDGLLVKALKCGVRGKMYGWIYSFLQNRKARVLVDGIQSRKFMLKHGVPQGGVVSPTLFLIYINDLIDDLPRGIKAALYADDLVMWCTEEYATTATYRMQTAVTALAAWARKWNVQINKEKSSTTLFTLTQQKAGDITLDDTVLKQDDEPTYLGVTYDKKQTWKPHIQKAETKAKRKLALLRKLAGSTWGANERTLRTVYEGSIRPHLEYGSAAWSTTAKTNLQTMDKVQNQALRLITGALRSSPIQAMEKATGIQPLQDRLKAKTAIQAERYKCHESHPMKSKLEGRTCNRLKRESFVHRAKNISRSYLGHLPTQTSQPLLHQSNPWEDTRANRVTICTKIPQISSEDPQAEFIKRNIAEDHCDERYPQDSWIRAYTDGSATDAVKDGGAGVYIRHQDGNTTSKAIPTGIHCSNYRAEVEALKLAVETVQDGPQDCTQVVFLTDALSVLEALSNNKEQELMILLKSLSRTHRVSLQWIPAHCGIKGNEEADQLAKNGAADTQPEVNLTYHEKKTLIKTTFKGVTQRDDYHLLNREDQVILFRLRTGHNRLNHHMNKRFKLVPSAACICLEGDQTAEHVLQRCPRLQKVREEVWPSPECLETKLYGGKEDLESTALFIRLANLKI